MAGGRHREEVLDALRAAPRIAFIRMEDGLTGLNTTVELMRDLGRPRGDMWEVALWEDVLTVEGDEAFLTYQVYNEAIVVPESIDAIRALAGGVSDGAASIAMTDEALVRIAGATMKVSTAKGLSPNSGSTVVSQLPGGLTVG